MKKTLLSLIFPLLQVSGINAQGIPEKNTAPVNSDQVHTGLSGKQPSETKAGLEAGKQIAEDARYHDGRWLWYRRQHTDVRGNLVSPVMTLREWNRYRNHTTKAKTTTSQSLWSFTGPNSSMGGYSGVGRINTIAFHPTDPNNYWIGSAGGGAWQTADDGLSWSAIADYLPVLSISDIDFNPLNPNTVYMCTGDRDGRDHYSVGVLKSYDGGISWDTTGLSWDIHEVRLTNSLLINPQDTNSLALATSEGIYRSFDGGVAFALVQPGNFKQLLYHPTDTTIVYATSFFTYQNGTDAQIFRSADGGTSWVQVTSFTDTWRIELAVTPAAPGVVKAVAASRDTNYRRGLHGVYSSANAGLSFQTVFSGSSCIDNILSGNMEGMGCTGQGNYDLCIAIHPQNANKIYIGGVNTWTSDNGGAGWEIVNQWWANLPGIAEVHADKHFLGFHPLVSGRLFEGNDGGIYKTDNPAIWTDITNGLGITQFYRNAVADVAPYVVAGAQDNGTKIFDSGLWDDVTGGDGMDCQIDFWDPQVFYTSIQYGGAIYRVDGFAMNIANGPLSQLEGAWITPFILHPHDPNTIIVGYQDIFYGNSFNWSNITNGSLGSKNILRLAMSPADADVLYAVPEDSSVIWRFPNYVTGVHSAIPVPYAEKISDLKVDPKDEDHIYVTFSGYGTNKVAEYSVLNGWHLLNENLPNVPVNCIEIDSASGYKYIGTDVAVFYRNDTMSQWELYNTDLPAVHIIDLGINYSNNEIWAATYGRGLWKSPRHIDITGIPEPPALADLKLHPNPSKGAFTVGLPEGYRGKTANCVIRDQMGRVVWSREGLVGSGNQIQVQGLQLAGGSYIVELSAAGKVLGRTPVIIQK